MTEAAALKDRLYNELAAEYAANRGLTVDEFIRYCVMLYISDTLADPDEDEGIEP